MRRHLLLPALLLLVFWAVVSLPAEVLGCRNRGLLAFGIALAGLLAALGCAVRALAGRWRGEPGTSRWLGSCLILSLPAFLLLALAR